MFTKLAESVAEALRRRHLPNRISQHEERILEWWGVRNHPTARSIIRQHVCAIRLLRQNLQRR
jgi:hypothetical protein